MSLSFTIDILKQFDGQYNYFNPSHCNGTTIFRRESKYDNKLLVSDIIDDKNDIILEHYNDDTHLYCYEDARFINQDEISVCVCKRKKEDLTHIVKVSYQKYNLKTKQFTYYKTQKSHFEKHWQFYEDKIIYHVNPYTIMDNNENILFTYDINWEPWIEKYGNPGLSTNVFEINGLKYLLFHSYISKGTLQFKYFIGLFKLDSNFNPIGYSENPIIISDFMYSDFNLIKSLWKWRTTEICPAVEYEVIFPMTSIVNDTNIEIYAGINDCSAGIIKISIEEFNKYLNSTSFTL